MVRLSSKATFFYKWIFPLTWFGFLAFAAVSALSGNLAAGQSPLTLLFIPVMAVVGYFIMRALIFDLVDEVWDDGNTLLVRNRGTEERIALADIKNVNYAPTSPPRVTLSLRRPGSFGDAVTFCAPLKFVPLARSPVIEDLIERIDATRKR